MPTENRANKYSLNVFFLNYEQIISAIDNEWNVSTFRSNTEKYCSFQEQSYYHKSETVFMNI